MLSRDAGEGRNEGTGSRPAGPTGGWTRRLLRVPLYWKLLLAHVAVVAAAVAAALWLQARLEPGFPPWLTAILVVAGAVTLSTFLTALALGLALTPLRSLERAAREILIEGGEASRLPIHPVADDELRDVVALFNEMLRRASEHRKQLRELTARALGSAEAERRRVGLLLQDEIAQRLASVLVQLRLLASADDGARRERVRGEAREQVADTLEEVRRLARALRPPELEELGLDQALTALLRETRQETGCEMVAEIQPVDRMLSHPAALALFRIVQESLLAVRRTGGRCRIDVRLYREANDVVSEVVPRFAVPDLDAWLEEKLDSPAAIGLMGMRERARFVGGTVSVDRDSEGRPRIRARVPVEGS